MPMRDDASYCRPRLYDRHDPEREDDIELLLDALDDKMTKAMATGDKDTVSHASELRRRIIRSAGDEYKDEQDRPEQAGADA